ncbi:MAG TPA: DUF1587 domain-containing protein, partial [Pirellulaceae bacterium]|nr:DUF1587 domain-containing protein [Pirellulaceae bacterium]
MAGILAIALVSGRSIADESAVASHYGEHIRPLLARHCFACHAIEEPEGDLRLDKLSLDFADNPTRDAWVKVLSRLKSGEMPPKEKPRVPEQELAALVEWVRTNVEPAEAAARAARGRTVLRRLNRAEYQNTIRDLLGVDVDLTQLLPEDTAAAGFDNVGEGLHTSSFLMERYLDAA